MSQTRYLKLRPGVWLTALFLILPLLGVTPLLAQPAPGHAVPPVLPGAPDNLVPPSDPQDDRDSIYATEITVDMSGVTIVDRSGRRRHLTGRSIARLDEIRLTDSIGPDSVIVIPARRHQEDVVHLASDVTVDRDETVRGNVVCIFGSRVAVLGRVTGSAISVFGNVDVDGFVTGDVVAPFGQVHIGPGGSVAGDVVASEIRKEPGGRIGGTREEILFNVFGARSMVPQQSWPQATLSVLVILNALFWLFLVLLAHALAAKNVCKMKERIERSFVKAFFVGLLAEILILPAFLLLLVTIIGIPVAVFLIPLMVAATLVLSQASTGLLVGEKITENTALALRTPLSRTLTGYMALQSIPLLGLAFAWTASENPATAALRVVSIVLFGITILLGYFITTIGAGAVVMTRFGTRPKDAIPAPAVDTPPSGPNTTDHRAPTPLPLRSENLRHPHGDSGTTDTAPVSG